MATISESIKDKLDVYRHDPRTTVKVVMEHIENHNDIDIVDASNPFVCLLELAVLTSSNTINSTTSLMRKSYIRLSQDYEDLYPHINNVEILNQFAIPSNTNIFFVLPESDIENYGVMSESGNYHQITIPRHTLIKADELSFLTLYPIEIKKYVNSSILISLDTDITHPLYGYKNRILKHQRQIDQTNQNWIHFNVNLPQLSLVSYQDSIIKNNYYSENYSYDDDIVAVFVYHKVDGAWTKIEVSLSEHIHDTLTPTAYIKLTDVVTVTIPSVYLNNGLISNSIRIDIYTTKGDIDVDMAEIGIDSYTREALIIDPDNDNTLESQSFRQISYSNYGLEKLEGGRSSIGFNDLRTRVINQSLGPIETPITKEQVITYIDNKGFSYVKYLEILNGQMHMVTKGFESSYGDIKVDISPDMTIGNLIFNPDDINGSSGIVTHDNSTVIKSNTLFLEENGIFSILPDSKVLEINQSAYNTRVNLINNLSTWFSPFYYKFDFSNDVLDISVYDLDNPSIKHVNFYQQNNLTGIDVNTNTTDLQRTTTGFTLNLSTISGDGYKNLDVSEVNIQARITSNNKGFYLKGDVVPAPTTEGEKVFNINLDTNLLLQDGGLTLTNLYDIYGIATDTVVGMEFELELYYTTDSSAIPHEYSLLDKEVNAYLLPENTIVISKEIITVKIGDQIDTLWHRGSMIFKEDVYVKHLVDVPLTYTKDVYQINSLNGSNLFIDSETCSVSRIIEHHAGETVRDHLNEAVLKYRIGDNVLDNNGDPIVDKAKSMVIEVDLPLLEGLYYFADAENHVSYLSYITDLMRQRLNSNLIDINRGFQEQSMSYYGSYVTHGKIKALNNKQEVMISARKDLSLTIYLRETSTADINVKTLIQTRAIEIINSLIHQKEIFFDVIRTELNNSLGDVIHGVHLTDENNEALSGLIKIKNDDQQTVLNKVMYINNSGKLAVKPTTEVKFVVI